MTLVANRSLDTGAAFPVWAPAGDSENAACGHGVWVELPLDAPTDELAREVSLLLRHAERNGETSVKAHGPKVAVGLSLATARCSPRDEPAGRFLAQLPWLDGELALRLDWLRERAGRAVAQRDRSSCDTVLRRRANDKMIGYDELFPADWDLLVQHGGATYWLCDQHCPKATCPCTSIVVQLYRIDGPSTDYAGKLTLDLHGPHRRPETTTPVAAALFEQAWRRYGEELVRRHQEVRAAVQRPPTPIPTPARPTAEAPTPSRNGPCPCGSGRKYKRCCAGTTKAPGEPG
jgi:SEC-C motif